MKKIKFISTAVCLLGLYIVSPAYAQYTYTEFSVPNSYYTEARAVNNNEVAVGWSQSGDVRRGFIYDNGNYTTLDLIDIAYDINDSGTVVGDGLDGRAYAYNSGTYTELLPTGWTNSRAMGINNNGDIVGYGSDGAGNGGSFIYSNGIIEIAPLPVGFNMTNFQAINDNGIVTGYGSKYVENINAYTEVSFIYDNGTYTELLNQQYSTAHDINNSGVVAGRPDNSGQTGFIYNQGAYTYLNFAANAINENGEVVGYRGYNAYHYSNGTSSTIMPTERSQSFATDINDNGVITGMARNYNGGQEVSFLATPTALSVVPEPISSILFITGGATFGFRRFRKNFKK